MLTTTAKRNIYIQTHSIKDERMNLRLLTEFNLAHLSSYRCDVTIATVVLTHCQPESNFANLLPCFWQTFAMPMAKFCQRGGKVLPRGWQNLANLSARKTKVISLSVKKWGHALNIIPLTGKSKYHGGLLTPDDIK